TIARNPCVLAMLEGEVSARQELTADQKGVLRRMIAEARARVSDEFDENAPVLEQLAQPHRAAATAATPIHVPADHVEVHKKPSIAFKAFPMVDPKTGKPVSATTKVELPGGQQMPAEEFYRKLNQLEKDLCAIGHTLRGKGETRLAQVKTNHEAASKQVE